jgi:hypothetical protein
LTLDLTQAQGVDPLALLAGAVVWIETTTTEPMQVTIE